MICNLKNLVANGYEELEMAGTIISTPDGYKLVRGLHDQVCMHDGDEIIVTEKGPDFVSVRDLNTRYGLIGFTPKEFALVAEP